VQRPSCATKLLQHKGEEYTGPRPIAGRKFFPVKIGDEAAAEKNAQTKLWKLSVDLANIEDDAI
jgi:hypothetical protein